MLFNSVQFLLFYLVVVIAFFALPYRFRWMFLLAASYFFYMCWKPAYVVIIWIITLIDYLAGIRIEESKSARARKAWLLLSVLSNFGVLFLFKYTDFVLQSFSRLFHPATNDAVWLGWLLPVGLSFHTFQGVAYTIDVYRRKFPAERRLGIYALYVAFFPQMVAGPIERPAHLLPQFRKRTRFEDIDLRSGLELILLGLFKKMIVGDLLASIVNRVFDAPRQFGGSMLAIASVAFAIELYADFSGYSDMAVGLARILGYELTINFRQPYFAGSIAELWRRWHISLSSWFRDYVYLPMGGNAGGRTRWILNILVVFLLSGLWHGANWTFVAWGAIHGLYVIFGRLLEPVRAALARWSGLATLPALRQALNSVITFGLFAWALIFFRAKTIPDGAYIAMHCFLLDRVRLDDLLTILPAFELALLALAIVTLGVIEYLHAHPDASLMRHWETRRVRWAVYCAALYGVVCFGVYDRVEFIYFQF